MTLPVRHRPGRMMERTFPGWRSPMSDVEELFDRMSRLLESAPMAEGIGWVPLADISETDDAFVIEAEVPGVRGEDIDVEMSDRELIITGELAEPEHKGVLRRSTRRSGRFEYRALLPGEIKPEDITADLSQGVLTVTVPKAQAARPRRIEVKSQG